MIEEENQEIPKRKKNFRGMKNRKYKRKVIRKKRVKKPNSAQKELNDYQAKTRKEFLKRKAHETEEEWEKRTRRRRLFGVNKTNDISIASDGKMVSYGRKLNGVKRENKLVIKTRFIEKPYDFLKHYAFVMRWASVRYHVLKEDIELGYYFYDGEPFTKEDFVLACIQLGTVRGVFNRFYRSGYIMPISIISRAGVVKNTEYYSLTVEFQYLIKRVYGVLSKVTPMMLTNRWELGKQSEELMDLLIAMNTEIEEIIRGERNPEKIIFRNENEL
jgi:hypothetical protein